MISFSFLSKRRGAMLAGVFSLAAGSMLLLCGAGSVPVENFLPQGTMQGDLDAGGHNLTNAATVSATNVIVRGSLTAPSLGSLAGWSPTGTASSSTYLRGDNTWAAVSGDGSLTLGSYATAAGFTFNSGTLDLSAAPNGANGLVQLDGNGMLGDIRLGSSSLLKSFVGDPMLRGDGSFLYPGRLSLTDASGNLYSNLPAGQLLVSGGGGLGVGPITGAPFDGSVLTAAVNPVNGANGFLKFDGNGRLPGPLTVSDDGLATLSPLNGLTLNGFTPIDGSGYYYYPENTPGAILVGNGTSPCTELIPNPSVVTAVGNPVDFMGGLQSAPISAGTIGNTGSQTVMTATATPVYGRAMFRIGGTVTITTGTDSVQLVVSYTDENGNPQTVNVGAPSTTTALVPISPIDIRVTSGAVITVSTTAAGTATYDVTASIQQIGNN